MLQRIFSFRTVEIPRNQKPVFPNEIGLHVLSFLSRKELLIADKVNKFFRSLINTAAMRESVRINFIPESLPKGITYKHFFLNLFPNALGADVYRENLGEVDIIPKIPRHFIERAKEGKLVLIPEFIAIEVDENSPFELIETKKMPRLVKNLDQWIPTGKIKKLLVPVTLNNILLLVQKLSKKNSQFGGLKAHWKNVCRQHGDTGVGPSHWSLQKIEAIAIDDDYSVQVKQAQDAGYEVIPIVDRILFYLLSYLKTGKFPENTYVERTSTATFRDNGESRQTAIHWQSEESIFYLSIDYFNSYFRVGVAVRIPSE